jgi:16S rRNA (guanine527-N7)-methyltransferase
MGARGQRPGPDAPRPRRDPATGRRPPDPGARLRPPDAAALAAALADLGLRLPDGAVQQLLSFAALLSKWNAVYNLTAIRDPGAILVQHLFDCLAIVPPLRAAPATPAAPAGTASPASPASPASSSVIDLLADGTVVLDVGSGGGLPGVVLAICAPGAQVHCVDAVGKKAAFLTQVRAELALANLHSHHARVEDLSAPRDLPAPTLVVSRAFASLAHFTTITAHLLAPGGVWAAMKGALPADELDALAPGVRLRAAITLDVPQLDARRHLLLLERSR